MFLAAACVSFDKEQGVNFVAAVDHLNEVHVVYEVENGLPGEPCEASDEASFRLPHQVTKLEPVGSSATSSWPRPSTGHVSSFTKFLSPSAFSAPLMVDVTC